MTKKDGGSSARSTFFLLIPVLFLLGWFLLPSFNLSPSQTRAAGGGQTKFQRISTQYIAALGDPGATSGSGAQSWGLWPLDPGPRGVELTNYQRLKDAGGVAPARWKFDSSDWWLEEHGLIMEQPTFPLPPGKYMATGRRDVTAEKQIKGSGVFSLTSSRRFRQKIVDATPRCWRPRLSRIEPSSRSKECRTGFACR